MQEMLFLKDAWSKYDYHFFTYTSEKTKNMDVPKTLIYPPWKSSWRYVRDLLKAFVYITFNRPDVLISTGMGWVDIFLFPYCKLLKVHTIYIESGQNTEYITGTGNFIKGRFCDRFFVQSKELAEKIGAEYIGGLL